LLLVDDHDLVRAGVRSLLESVPDWTVCAEAASGEEALKAARECRPDIAVVDISLPRISGIDIILQLKRLVPNIAILVLTMHDGEHTVVQALRAGARAYLLKSDPCGEIIEAVSALSRGQSYFSNLISEALLQAFLHSGVSSQHDLLTPRERQIVKLIAEGGSNKQMARFLGLSVKTVETHRAALTRKIGAKSSADIAFYALRNDLVQV
jgi:DNA-binding NarL/FixJ family response regulator